MIDTDQKFVSIGISADVGEEGEKTHLQGLPVMMVQLSTGTSCECLGGFSMFHRLVILSVTVASLSFGSQAHAQFFAEADWVFLNRNHDGDVGFVAGPESVAADSAGFDYRPGVKLTIGAGFFDYQVNFSYTEIDSWQGFSSGTFTNPIAFDDGFGSPFIAPANRIVGNNVLFQAATYTNGMPMADETLEIEHLRAGATYNVSTVADFRDFELNFGSSRDQLWRWGVGYRHIKLDERNRMMVSGVFDAIDTDDGAVAGDITNDMNDGLSHDALVAVGLTNIAGGADGFDAFDSMNGPDTITYISNGLADNELHGAQLTLVGTIFNGEWLTVEGIGKAGIYRNNITAGVTETIAGSGNDDSVYQRSMLDKRREVAFGGNLGVRGVVSLTDYINLVAGYEALFLHGLASASEQTNGLGVNPLGGSTFRAQTYGSMIAHGGRLGLELLW